MLQNTQAAYDYLWTKGYWKNSLTAGANYTYRFMGKYQTRFQLNVTNLLNTLDPIWGRSGIGNDAYFLSADGYLMPTKKGQQPPDARYFKEQR